MGVITRDIGKDTFRQDRLCVEDTLVDNTGYGGKFLDANRDLLFNFLYPSIKAVSDKMITYRKIGKDTQCLTRELTDHFVAIELFLLILEEQTCFGIEGWPELEQEYKLDCMREHWKCAYGKGDIIEDIIKLLKLRFGADGIDYMTISGDVCTPFKIR